MKVARSMFSRHTTTPAVDTNTTMKTFSTLYEAVEKKAGEMSIDLSHYSDTRASTLIRLRTNLLTFVAFKNYNQSAEMMKALIDEKGNIRSWSSFERAVIALDEKYNRNWLRAEYNTVTAAAQTAAQWADFERSKHLFPYLIYKTQDDNKVRPAHALLHDVAKHIDDPFWDSYYPPNGWNCRCYILQSRSDQGYVSEPSAYPDDKSHPPAFRTNPGKSGKIWNDKHPYFDLLPDVRNTIMKVRNELMQDKTMFDNIEGVNVHFSNYANNAFEQEFRMAKLIKTVLDTEVDMLSQFDAPGTTCPDFLINGDTVAEYKHITSTNLHTIEKNVRGKGGALDQLLHSRHADKKKAVILSLSDETDKQQVLNKLIKSERITKHQIELWILHQGSLTKHKAE